MKQVFLLVSITTIGVGLYLKFMYDVPDSQEATNLFVSWFLIIIGVSSSLINIFWKGENASRKDGSSP